MIPARCTPPLLLSAAFAACVAGALAGCAPSATFVSAEAPPNAAVDVAFANGIPAVSDALRRAMGRSGITVKPGLDDARVVGVRQQVPYVGAGATDPAPGELPVYRVTATVTRREVTRVRAIVEVLCPACDGTTPYEWEYPTDVLRHVIDGAREILRERGGRVAYPPRHRPARWRPPRQQ